MAYNWSGAVLTYSIANDITIGKINHDLLIVELKALEPFSAVYQSQDTVGSVAKLTYDTPPNAADKTLIETAITDHSGVITTRSWQKVEHNAIQEKSGAGFTTKLTLTATPLAAGKYRIMFNGEARIKAGEGLTSQPKFRIKVDGSTKMIRTITASLEWDGRSGWDFMQFGEGDTPVIIVEVQRFGGTETIQVQKLKLSIEEMPE